MGKRNDSRIMLDVNPEAVMNELHYISKKSMVLWHILTEMDENNTLSASAGDVSDILGISENTVIHVLGELVKSGVIKKQQYKRTHIMVNPGIACRVCADMKKLEKKYKNFDHPAYSAHMPWKKGKKIPGSAGILFNYLKNLVPPGRKSYPSDFMTEVSDAAICRDLNITAETLNSCLSMLKKSGLVARRGSKFMFNPRIYEDSPSDALMDKFVGFFPAKPKYTRRDLEDREKILLYLIKRSMSEGQVIKTSVTSLAAASGVSSTRAPFILRKLEEEELIVHEHGQIVLDKNAVLSIK